MHFILRRIGRNNKGQPRLTKCSEENYSAKKLIETLMKKGNGRTLLVMRRILQIKYVDDSLGHPASDDDMDAY